MLELPMGRSFGFTFIEIIVVAALIGVLATIFMNSYPASQKRARDTRRANDLKEYQAQLENFANNNGGYYPSYKGGVRPNGQFLCENLFPDENPPCPAPGDPREGQTLCGDPEVRVSCEYLYESDGDDGGSITATQYVLTAPMEMPDDVSNPYFVVCSTGESGFESYSHINNTDGRCPVGT